MARQPTEAESQLLTAAVSAGATVRRDDAWTDFLNGEGGLPLNWGCYIHAEDCGDPTFDEAAEQARSRRAAFFARMAGGDLKALAYRVVAERAAREHQVAA